MEAPILSLSFQPVAEIMISTLSIYPTDHFLYFQETPRVFVNNVTIRFHPALELEEDETKTVVCRYPPPLTQPPGIVQVIEPPT